MRNNSARMNRPETPNNAKAKFLGEIAHRLQPGYEESRRLHELNDWLLERISFIAHPQNDVAVADWVAKQMAKQELNEIYGDMYLETKVFEQLRTQVVTCFDGQRFVFQLETQGGTKPREQSEPHQDTAWRRLDSRESWLYRYASLYLHAQNAEQKYNPSSHHVAEALHDIVSEAYANPLKMPDVHPARKLMALADTPWMLSTAVLEHRDAAVLVLS